MFGTCAGMILLASAATDGIPDQPLLARMDIVVRRNGYGRQLASFEADLELAGDEEPLHGVFIRAPRIVERRRRGRGRWRRSTAIPCSFSRATSSPRHSIRS